ncbi:HNH endonuclease [Variovorax sp. VNK109]|uniref:HNH endonuclease n=1 Tax=Variovorax sp. VNK109 TaxID=3400919 RepID=UPI003C071E2C
MAKTLGHGNPPWTRDETILALDLLQRRGMNAPGPEDPDVQELSQLLRALPIYAENQKLETFRNAAGVAFKMKNLKAVDGEGGLKNVSTVDREVWRDFGQRPDLVKQLVEAIKSGAEELKDEVAAEPEDIEFWEGRTVTAVHLRRERKASLRHKVIANRRKVGHLCCEACGHAPSLPNLEDAEFECHHVRPLATTGIVATKLADVALLCANCHRLLHRLMVAEKRWVSVESLKQVLERRVI